MTPDQTPAPNTKLRFAIVTEGREFGSGSTTAWDYLPEAANPDPGATSPGSRSCVGGELPGRQDRRHEGSRGRQRRHQSDRALGAQRSAIRLPRARRGTRITSASVRVNGRRVAVSAGARRRATVDLRSLPRGTFAVQVRVVLSDGSVLAQTRRFWTCVPRRP